MFKALQTYADGEVVRWIDEPVQGAEEPEHPAPVLALDAAQEPAGQEVAPDTEPVASATDAGGGAPVLAASAFAVGLVALGVAAFAALQDRRST